ncbi:aminopeptidase C [Olsenella sp. Marseille-P4559]|jgi:bleomycin hydrolase|uniref:aminopeptidase C n=1 Tax=Olsenella sp. Marseille-P4559 TaxID=2364795 RepID=UPI001030AF95|nr:C1 family peptidase [Olsenella sp. Marseille-P4559]
MGSVGIDWACEQGAAFSTERANRVARNAVTSMNVMAAARDYTRMRAYHDTYGVSIKRTGDVTNQRQSGRCWMFSAYNVARAATMDLLDVDSFEFSQAFGMFYDKLEKANAMLDHVIALVDRPDNDRELDHVLEWGMSDGGYYFEAMDLIAKWGLVPKDVMPETACSKSSAEMDAQLNRLLRRTAAEIRRAHRKGASAEGLAAKKDACMAGVYRMLSICLGEPPATFDLEVKVGKKAKADTAKLTPILPEDASKSANDADAADTKDAEKEARMLLRDAGITPREFAERYVPFDPNDYVQLVCMPGASRPWKTAWHVLLEEPMVGGTPNRFLNMPQEVLEQAAIASLRAGVPVGMDADVMQEFPRHIADFPGVLATDGLDLEGLFGMDLKMDREDMLDVRETSLTHAMTFQGVEFDEAGKPVAWRVENSWGKDSCKDGYLYMSADWFRTYGGAVTVMRKFVPEDVLELWDKAKAVDVEPWDGVAVALGVCTCR